jgi:hypothetical protein
MASATLHFNMIQKRVLPAKQAAIYVGMTLKRFEAACPVVAINFGGSVLGYDLRDLDQWIDSLKAGFANDNHSSLIERLG